MTFPLAAKFTLESCLATCATMAHRKLLVNYGNLRLYAQIAIYYCMQNDGGRIKPIIILLPSTTIPVDDSWNAITVGVSLTELALRSLQISGDGGMTGFIEYTTATKVCVHLGHVGKDLLIQLIPPFARSTL